MDEQGPPDSNFQRGDLIPNWMWDSGPIHRHPSRTNFDRSMEDHASPAVLLEKDGSAPSDATSALLTSSSGMRSNSIMS